MSEPAPASESQPSPIVELTDVHLAFGEQEILKGVDLKVMPRERMVVLGQSGGGKSTLLRLVLGILKPQKGSVQFKGLEVTRMGRRRLNRMRQKIGMVYQYSALISSLNVRDNLALATEADPSFLWDLAHSHFTKAQLQIPHNLYRCQKLNAINYLGKG
ncbi:MAG: ATP-binding cassette domain-containing protein [Cytophagaceae bacterium]|nr:MAG: ATP-binding cassette domain-containing protein [Cytophagaceae bacterium]